MDDFTKIIITEESSNEYYEDDREYKCMRCEGKLEPYSFGLGTECRCKNCGYKDPCCE